MKIKGTKHLRVFPSILKRYPQKIEEDLLFVLMSVIPRVDMYVTTFDMRVVLSLAAARRRDSTNDALCVNGVVGCRFAASSLFLSLLR